MLYTMQARWCCQYYLTGCVLVNVSSHGGGPPAAVLLLLLGFRLISGLPGTGMQVVHGSG